MNHSSVFLFFLLSVHIGVAQNGDSLSLIEKAQAIHNKVITVDTHVDIDVNNFTREVNYTQDLDTQVNLPKLKKGGLDVVWFSVYTGQDALTPEAYKKAYDNAISKFKAIEKLVKEIAPGEIGLATTSEQARQLHKQGKLVAMIGVENAYPVGEDLGNIEKFYNMGARYMSLSHNGHSQFSDSNTGEETEVWLHHGLSDLGKRAVEEMNRLGMMIDVSHPSKEAIKQMFAISKAPLIASHSSARAIGSHSRNLDDELLLLFKKHGGVVQTVAFSAYIHTERHRAWNEAQMNIYREQAEILGVTLLDRDGLRSLSEEEQENYHRSYREVQAASAMQIAELQKDIAPIGVADFVDHIDYMVNLIGIDHVGISSDFDGGGGIAGWQDASETFNVTVELVKRGYNEQQIAQLWGANLLRVLDQVEAVADELKQSK